MHTNRLGPVALAFGCWAAAAAAQDLRTPAEQSAYAPRYSQHEDVARFLSVLSQASRRVAVRVIGRTAATSVYPAKDLYLVVLSANGALEPAELDRTKLTVLLIASQHGNEQSAKEAALRLIRDLAAADLAPLLEKANVLVIPQCNPYGNWADQRENETGLDLNRDHLKLESEEVRAIHRAFRAYLPEVTLDVHEKGDDYYRVSIGAVSNLNIDPALVELWRGTLLGEVQGALSRQGVRFHEYLVTEQMGDTGAAGVRHLQRPQGRAGRPRMTRFSTTDLNDGRNGLGIYQTLSFIQEGASRHDLATLHDRTAWQYAGVRALVESVAGHAARIVPLVRRLREAEKSTGGVGRPVHLRMDYARNPAQPTLTLSRFAEVAPPIVGVLKLDKKAGEPVSPAELAEYSYPPNVEVVEEVIENWFPSVESRLQVARPGGYLLPGRLQQTVETLLRHGIEVSLLTRDQEVEAQAYDVTELKPAPYDYLPPETIEVTPRQVRTLARQGDYLVSCAQPGANLIAVLLEPQSQYGLIRYSAYGLVPEKGGVFAVLRVSTPQPLALVPYRPWN